MHCSCPPRLLLLAYPFPPSRAIGAVRCWNIAKQLARIGWQVQVVTIGARHIAHPEPGIDIEKACRQEGIHLRNTPAAGRLLMGGWFKLAGYQPTLLARLARKAATRLKLDPAAPWIGAAVNACADLCPGQTDVVLASGPPYPAFAAAVQIARRLQAHAVLDYRDLWTGNPHYRHYANVRNHTKEKRLLAAASALTVVSSAMAQSLTHTFGAGTPITTITNGYDPDEYQATSEVIFPDYAVVYAGRFYPPHRVAAPLLAAIAHANTLGPSRPIRLYYYGNDHAHVNEAAAKTNARNWLKYQGNTSRAHVLVALKSAPVGAVITTVHPTASTEEQGILTGKLFEVVGAGSRVLLIAPAHSDAAILVNSSGVGAAFAGDQIEPMARWLVQQCNDPKPRDPAHSGAAFAWPNLAQRLDEFLRGVLARPLPPTPC